MSEDCQKCGTSMYDLDEERLCPGCSNHETETETMNASYKWAEALQSALISAKADKEDYAHNAIDLRKRVNALQQRLTAADERADVLEGLLLQTNELLYEIQGDPGAVPSSSIDAMRGKVFTALKPAEASDDSCEFCKGWGFRANPDGADEGCGACNGTGKEPAEPPKNEHVCAGCGSKGWTANCAECVPY